MSVESLFLSSVRTMSFVHSTIPLALFVRVTLIVNIDDMDVQLLLIVQQVCNQKHIQIPWAEIGSTLGPTITGGAVIQHLAKLRKRREAAGLPNPEPLKRGGGGPIVTKSDTSKPSSGKTRKLKVEKTLSSQTTSNSNGENEDTIDVDGASDPDESFGETHLAKRSKLSGSSRKSKASVLGKSRKGKATSTPKIKEGSLEPGERYVGAGADWVKLAAPMNETSNNTSSREEKTDEDSEDDNGDESGDIYGDYGDGTNETSSPASMEGQMVKLSNRITVLRVGKSSQARAVLRKFKNSTYNKEAAKILDLVSRRSSVSTLSNSVGVEHIIEPFFSSPPYSDASKLTAMNMDFKSPQIYGDNLRETVDHHQSASYNLYSSDDIYSQFANTGFEKSNMLVGGYSPVMPLFGYGSGHDGRKSDVSGIFGENSELSSLLLAPSTNEYELNLPTRDHGRPTMRHEETRLYSFNDYVPGNQPIIRTHISEQTNKNRPYDVPVGFDNPQVPARGLTQPKQAHVFKSDSNEPSELGLDSGIVAASMHGQTLGSLMLENVELDTANMGIDNHYLDEFVTFPDIHYVSPKSFLSILMGNRFTNVAEICSYSRQQPERVFSSVSGLKVDGILSFQAVS